MAKTLEKARNPLSHTLHTPCICRRASRAQQVIVDFEILPCGDQGAAFTKVEEALKDDKSSLKTGWLSSSAAAFRFVREYSE